MLVRSFRGALGLAALAASASLSEPARAATAGSPAQAGSSASSAGAASAGAPSNAGADSTMATPDPGSDAGCSYSVPSHHKDRYRSLRMLIVAASVLFACLRRKRAW